MSPVPKQGVWTLGSQPAATASPGELGALKVKFRFR